MNSDFAKKIVQKSRGFISHAYNQKHLTLIKNNSKSYNLSRVKVGKWSANSNV